MIVNSCPWHIVFCCICYVIVPENLVVSCNGDMEHLGLLLVFVYLICFLILNRGSTPYMQVKKMSYSHSSINISCLFFFSNCLLFLWKGHWIVLTGKAARLK